MPFLCLIFLLFLRHFYDSNSLKNADEGWLAEEYGDGFFLLKKMGTASQTKEYVDKDDGDDNDGDEM